MLSVLILSPTIYLVNEGKRCYCFFNARALLSSETRKQSVFLGIASMPELYSAIIALEVTSLVVVLILYMLEYRKDRRLQEEKEIPVFKELQEKNANALHEAMTRSHDIVAQAETESLKVIADAKTINRKQEEQIATELASLRAELEKTVNDQTSAALTDFQKYLETLRTKSSDAQVNVENLAKDRVNEFIEKFEQHLSDFLVHTQQESLSAIELELKSARNLIDTYKEKQIRIVNENILAMLERTISLVLSRKLTLKDQTDLIYESLEKAKVEKFMG